MKTLIARTKSGKEIEVDVRIDEEGKIRSNYTIERKGEHGYCVVLRKNQAKRLLDKDIKEEQTVGVVIVDQETYIQLKKEASRIFVEYTKNNNLNELEKMKK